MSKIRAAVIGVGYLGNFHADKYNQLEAATLVAVCDVATQRCQEVAAQHDCLALQDYTQLVGMVDAVSIVTPTPTHYALGKFFLENGIHVLMEKPITTTTAEAETLIQITKEKQLILQVGHLERFNNAIKALNSALHHPLYIESVRTAPFKLRGSDVNVILDLMIHDIDIIMSVVNADISDIRASGASILSDSIDIANARIEFSNGCVATVTASRVSIKTERKLRVFQPDCYTSLDLHNKQLRIHRKGQGEMFPGIPNIQSDEKTFEPGDPLKDEIAAFLHCIASGQAPLVGGTEGLRALQTAIRITQIVQQFNQQHPLAESLT